MEIRGFPIADFTCKVPICPAPIKPILTIRVFSKIVNCAKKKRYQYSIDSAYGFKTTYT